MVVSRSLVMLVVDNATNAPHTTVGALKVLLMPHRHVF